MPTFTLTTDDGQQHEFSPTVLRLNENDKLLIELQNDTPTEIMDVIVTVAAKWAEIDDSRVMVVDPGAKISVLRQEQQPKYKYVTEEELNKLIEQLFDIAHTTIAEIARQAGVTVATVRHHIKEAKANRQLQKAKRELQEQSTGWNPRSGPTKGLRN